MDGLELHCFQIISSAGEARSLFVEGVQLSKEEDFTGAQKKIEEGSELLLQSHKIHADLLQGNFEIKGYDILLMHAEDILMSAETFKLFAEEIIDLNKKFCRYQKK